MSEQNIDKLRELNNEVKVKPEVPWQMEHTKLVEQNLYLLKNSVWTDCVFIVGDDHQNKRFSAHKLMLSKASPVFSAMLLGQLAETKDIHITDIEPEVFETLLHYVYADVLQVKDHTYLLGLFMAAQKYMMPTLQKLCRQQMHDRLSPGTACWLYEIATVIDDVELKQLAWKVILERTDEVVNNSSFQNVKYDTVLEIVKCETLYLDSEALLISACMKWADNQVEKEGLEKTKEELQKSLGQILSYLRILTISANEFLKVLLLHDVYDNEEKVLILKKIVYPDEGFKVVDNLCTEVEKRNVTKLEFPNIIFTQNNNHCVSHNKCYSFSSFVPSCNILLHGITIDYMNAYSNYPPIEKHMLVTIRENDSTIKFNPIFGTDFCKSMSQYVFQLKFANSIKLDASKVYTITLIYNDENNAHTKDRGRASGFDTKIGKNIFTDLSFIATNKEKILLGMLITKV